MATGEVAMAVVTEAEVTAAEKEAVARVVATVEEETAVETVEAATAGEVAMAVVTEAEVTAAEKEAGSRAEVVMEAQKLGGGGAGAVRAAAGMEAVTAEAARVEAKMQRR